MSLLDTASLVITPNGYKEGKLYSVVPSDGSGDLNVTRATTATRVNASGLVELVPYNLFTYSEQFDNAIWDKVSTTVTPNTTIAPNGTLNADTLVVSSSGYLYTQINYSASVGDSITMSIYTKNSDANFLIFAGSTIAGTDISTIVNVGGGWYRHVITRTFTTSATGIIQFLLGYNFTGTYYIWGAQLVQGSTAKDYQKTETRLNIPRLDYSNGTCPSILVEPQRTNILTYSEDFGNAIWGKDGNGTGVTPIVTTNYATSPSGNNTADRIQFSNVGGSGSDSNYSLVGVYPLAIASVGTATIYLKSNTSSNQNVLMYWGAGQGQVFVVTPTWQRFTLSNLSISGLSNIVIGTRGGSGQFYTGGDESLDILVWGAQLEAGSYATSYIPTTSASVTRNADVISKTGISSLIGQSEGVVFFDYTPRSNYPLTEQNLLTVYDSASVDNNNLQFFIGTSSIIIYVVSGGSLQTNLNTGISPLARHKIAVAYKNNDLAVYIDGALVGTDTSITVPALNSIVLNNYGYGSYMSASEFSNIALWKTRLTNTQLAQLTTI